MQNKRWRGGRVGETVTHHGNITTPAHQIQNKNKNKIPGKNKKKKEKEKEKSSFSTCLGLRTKGIQGI